MLFTTSTLASLWDVWLYYEDGRHHLFYLASTTMDRPWDAIGLAVSSDGVHFEDLGLIVGKDAGAEWLGTGHTWRSGDRYIMDFSESRNGTIEVLFAESADLIHWERISPETSLSRLDPRWYARGTEVSDQRWDNIYVIPDETGRGFFGYVTAISKDGPLGLRGTAGSVRSADGVSFQTDRPVIEPGTWGDKLELGGVERIDGSYYMLVAQAEVPLGARWTAHHPQAAGGVYVLRAEHQEGPFELDPRQQPVLASAPRHYTYYARFYRTPDALLACHHAIGQVDDIVNIYPKPGTSLAPLKLVDVRDGVLTFNWWPGNDALYGTRQTATLSSASARGCEGELGSDGDVFSFASAAAGIVGFAEHLDFDTGLIVDTETALISNGRRSGAVGFLIGHGGAWSGTMLLLDETGNFAVGPYNGYAFRAADTKEVSVGDTFTVRWRVLVKGTSVEVYLNDRFVQGYTLPAPPTGRLCAVVESGAAYLSGVELHAMR